MGPLSRPGSTTMFEGPWQDCQTLASAPHAASL